MLNFFKTRVGAVLGGLIFFIVLLGGVVTIFELHYVGRFYPGVAFAGVELSGTDYLEARSRVESEVEKLEKEGLVLLIETKDASYILNVPMSVSGLTSDTIVNYFDIGDWEKVLMESYNFGRSGSVLSRLRQQVEALVGGERKEFPFAFYSDSVEAFLNREFDRILASERPAGYIFKDGFWQVKPEEAGEFLSSDEVMSEMKQLLGRIDANKLELKAEISEPETDKVGLERYLDFVSNAIAPAEFRFRYDGYNAYLSGWTLAGWLKIDPIEEGDFNLQISRDKLEFFLKSKLGIYLENPVQNSRFEFVGGALVEISPGKSGNAIDFDKLLSQMNQFLADQYSDFTVPVIGQTRPDNFIFDISIITQEPKITQETIDQYKIKELVASATTSFRGSGASRIHNIRLAASKLNGLLLAPGEEFSAVNSIGYVREEEGYEKEYVIKGNESIKEFGGGLCQLATTLFRMALDGGLPVSERQNHSYVVGYYGPGLDATIYGPHPDLRFVNDTDHYLLLQSRADGTELTFELYGQKDGRMVNISEPEIYDRIAPPEPKYLPSDKLAIGQTKCTETARYGLTAEVTYTVKYPDGSEKSQVFKSVYRPWQKVCLVGIRTY